MSLIRFVLIAVLLTLTTAAQAVDPALFQDLQWRLIGPFRGGRVLAVTGVLGEPNHFYFGAVNGGVWETLDAGRTWQPIFDGQPVASIGAIAVADSDPKIIYAGTGEADMRSDIAQGAGVYKSTDAGKTWQFSGLRDSQQIGKIAIDPRDANTVFVAALGHPYGPNAERGVFRSRDGGAHWQKVLSKDDDTGAINVTLEPGNPQVVYAALWQTRRPPWNVYPPSSGPGSGLYKSSDGGDHWTQIRGNGFPAITGRIGLAISAATPQRVYAIVDGDAGGLYRSDDAGQNWKHTSADSRIWQRGWYFGEVAVDPKNPDRVYVMNTIVLRSDDGGKTFAPHKGDQTGDDFHAMWIDVSNPDRQILGVDQGALVTLNGGRTWSSWHNQPTAQIYHVSVDKRFPYWVYGAQQDSGAVTLPSRSGDGNGIGMPQFHEITAGGESDNIAPDPDDPDKVFGGRVDELDLRTQQTRNVDPTLALPDLYRATWTLPLVFSPRNPHILYFANQRLFRTSDRGEHWEPASPDLTRENPDVPKTLDAATSADNLGQGPRRGVIYAIAPSPFADGLIWTGTDDGLIWRTGDNGAHWQNLTPPSVGAWSKIAMIDASPFDADSAYAAIDRHRLDDQRPYILRTHDGGKTWQPIVAGLPQDRSVNVVRADPVRKGLMYAGTEHGVYISFDDGDHWQSLQQKLPITSVRDIVVHDADVVIATHGRGFWVLDDVSALRQITSEVMSASAWLFAPAPSYRVRIASFSGTSMPKDEPVAANPPTGAWIDYELKAAPKDAVTLDIVAADGKLVRHYSSADKPKAFDPAKAGVAPEWVSTPSVLSASPGMHRFVWPQRWQALSTSDTPDPYADGIWAKPGEYKIKLVVDGQTLSQKLELLPDPRITLPQDAYEHQFALAARIAELHAQLARVDGQAETLGEALIKARAANPALVRDIDRVEGELHEITGTRPAPNSHNSWSFPAHSTKTLRFVNESLDKLDSAVEGADADPSPDAIHGVDAIVPIQAATLKLWDDFVKHDVGALNDKLRAAKKEPLVVAPKQ